MSVFVTVLLLWIQGPECAGVSDCRTQAEAAAAKGDYETFHDLAWRAVQKGKPDDADLLYLLARAQARSGRYGDAIVMLGRLADRHVAVDAATNEDFAKLRLLPEWPSLAARLRGEASSTAAPSTSAPSTEHTAPTPDALEFTPPPSLDPFALAHDAVSRRFVIGDRARARLLVVDERSHNLVTYVTAPTAGFYERVTGLAIDAKRGDLWVTSVKTEDGASRSALHKLQLISGRTLMAVTPAALDLSLAAVGVSGGGTVYTIDAVDGRLFRLRPGSRSLELVMRVDVAHPAAIAVADDRSVVIAGERGLTRVDVAAHAARAIASAQDLGGFVTLALRDHTIVGVRRIDGAFSVVHVTLDASGARVASLSQLATSTDSIVGTLAGDMFYFLSGRTIHALTVR